MVSRSVPTAMGMLAMPPFWTAVVSPKAVPMARPSTTRAMDGQIAAAYALHPGAGRAGEQGRGRWTRIAGTGLQELQGMSWVPMILVVRSQDTLRVLDSSVTR